ncbi:hypothetical protein [Phaeobacter sp. 22II1-1F12B]|uniref:hypothetical protein n=1 Tax=Phaeobacter sp. 22II1-1F12B TaxID=1317111 RepID=UPI000B525EF3|nr:hypothetical protein [Phaeobacter sp. 22II1-1F12B]OWU80487.1 hypothetical protein ATO1_09105 [Phaeobacter sp. 22II1-1F12B]
MTAPDTNVEKQARNHRGPLWGIMLCFVFVALLTVGWLVLYGDEEPGGSVGTDTNPQVTAPAGEAETAPVSD